MKNIFWELFRAQVERNGAKTAVIDPGSGRAMSYATLRDYARRVAAKMRAAGVRAGDAVALIMPNGVEETAAILAAMELRVPFAPLNGLYPLEFS